MRVVVGRVGRAQGVRGEVNVQVRTDFPDQRFAEGARLVGMRDSGEALFTVAGSRWQSGRLVLALAGVTDRNAAEALRGMLLEADVDVAATDDSDDYHDQALIGLEVRDSAGLVLGSVREVAHLPGQDLLVVDMTAPEGSEEPGGGSQGQPPEGPSRGESSDSGSGSGQFMVPFVQALVPVVDVAGGFLVVEMPEGLEGLLDGSP